MVGVPDIPGMSRVQRRYLTTRRNRESEREEDSWPKRTFLPLVSNWLKPYDSAAPETGRCFFPSPKVTFLIDQPEDLVCQICQHSRLAFQEQSGPGKGATCPDSIPAIMPCGHVSGARCLSNWLQDHNTCPFCRRELVYPACGHRVPVRRITREEIFLIPATIPEGGSIPDLCPGCYKSALRRTAEVRFEACRRRFGQAKRRFLASNNVADAALLMQRKSDLENIMFDEYHTKLAGVWLSLSLWRVAGSGPQQKRLPRATLVGYGPTDLPRDLRAVGQ